MKIKTILKNDHRFSLMFENPVITSTKFKDHPYRELFRSLLRFFANRGFIIDTPIYHKEESFETDQHKTGIKWNGVVVTLDVAYNSIEIEFGNVKNLWGDWGTNFWPTYNERYVKLNYLENKAIELEIKRWLSVNEYPVFDSSTLTPEQTILRNESINDHVHGGQVTLQDLSDYINTNGFQYDLDCDGKKIVSGTEIFFIGQDNRMRTGVAYHDMNMMWYIISQGKLYRNVMNTDISSTYKMGRIFSKNELRSRLDKLINIHSDKRDFLRCHKLQTKLNELNGTK